MEKLIEELKDELEWLEIANMSENYDKVARQVKTLQLIILKIQKQWEKNSNNSQCKQPEA